MNLKKIYFCLCHENGSERHHIPGQAREQGRSLSGETMWPQFQIFLRCSVAPCFIASKFSFLAFKLWESSFQESGAGLTIQ